jgi:hypothetical protein
MERLRELLRRTEFHGLLFCLSILAFSWPMIKYSSIDQLIRVFKYVFGVWAIIIAVLFMVGRSLASASSSEDTDKPDKWE